MYRRMHFNGIQTLNYHCNKPILQHVLNKYAQQLTSKLVLDSCLVDHLVSGWGCIEKS